MKVDEAQFQFLKTYVIDYIAYEEKDTEELTALPKVTLLILHKAKTWRLCHQILYSLLYNDTVSAIRNSRRKETFVCLSGLGIEGVG